MAGFHVNIDKKGTYVAGAKNIDLVALALVGSAVSVPGLHVSGLKTHSVHKSEHLTWVDQRINVGETFAVTIADCDDVQSPGGTTLSDPTKVMERLVKIGEEIEGIAIPPLPPILFFNMYFEVKINDEERIDAPLLDYDQLQLEMIWHKSKNETQLNVASISIMENGYTDSKTWINRELRFGDSVKVAVKASPNKSFNSDAAKDAARG